MYKMLLAHLGFGRSMTNMEKASYEVAFKGKREIAEGTYEFTFEKPKNFHFNAGQHVRMTLLNPSESDSKGDSRFMTLANTPQEKDLVIAMRMTDSAFKKVLGQMKIGEKILIQILLHSPHGSFTIHTDPSIPAVFLAGGIGIVPAFSMIKDATERKLQHKIFLFYSNRRPEDAPYLEELQDLAKQNPNFELIATMTESAKSTNAWKGETGHIDQTLLKKYLDDLKAPIYYIAGLTGMVNAMKVLLRNIGVDENNVRSEDFSAMKRGIMNMSQNPKRNKKYLVFAAIVLVITFGILTHAGIVISIFKNGFNPTSLNNPLLYLMIVVMIVAAKFKLKQLLKFKHAKNKIEEEKGVNI